MLRLSITKFSAVGSEEAQPETHVIPEAGDATAGESGDGDSPGL